MFRTTVKLVSFVLSGVVVLWAVAIMAVALPDGNGSYMLPDTVRAWLLPNNQAATVEPPENAPEDEIVISDSVTTPAPATDPAPAVNIVVPPPRTETLSPLDAPFPEHVSLCPFMTVTNAPPADSRLRVSTYSLYALAEDQVEVAVAPVAAGCLSSGYGPRRGSAHKGVDYHNKDVVDVYAAASGTVKRRLYRDDYGNMVVIDHGDGVFTRYAHLEDFSDIDVGDQVAGGEVIGQMGMTGNGITARHLHYEVMTGDWSEQAGSFALDSIDVFSLPAID